MFPPQDTNGSQVLPHLLHCHEFNGCHLQVVLIIIRLPHCDETVDKVEYEPEEPEDPAKDLEPSLEPPLQKPYLAHHMQVIQQPSHKITHATRDDYKSPHLVIVLPPYMIDSLNLQHTLTHSE